MTIAKFLTACIASTLVLSAHAEEVVIASVAGFTGPVARTINEGGVLMRGYVDMINASGGINGNTLKFLPKDDQYNPKQTIAMAEEAVLRDKAVILVNSAGTSHVAGLLKTGFLAKHKVPLVGVFSGSEAIRGPGSEQVFHTRGTYEDEVMKSARLASTLGLKKIAVLYQDDGFGASIAASVTKAADVHKLDIIQRTVYKPGEKNFAPYAKEIIAAKPDAIFLMGLPEAVNLFMKSYDAPKGASQIYALSFVTPTGLVEVAGEERVRGVGITQVVPNPNNASLPLAKDFQTFLKSPYGKDVVPHALNFEVYLNIRLAVEAIKLAGPKPTPEKVTQALKSMRDYRVGGFPINFGETNRRGSSYMDIAVIGRNGRLSY